LTLSEVLISTTIVGAVAMVATPKFIEATKRAKESALKSDLQTIRKAVDQFNADTGGWPESISDLLGDQPPKSWFRNGKAIEWKEAKWNGPYLGFGEKGPEYVPKDVISQKPYRTQRLESGKLKIYSSMTGLDTNGKKFEDY
jgi:type II secretory pathway pseudopilin PulG